MTIPFSQVKPASLKMKVLPRYPAKYLPGPGIAIEQAAGIVTTSVDFANLVRDDITDPTTLYVAGWDNANHLFKLVLGSNLKGVKGDQGNPGPATPSDFATKAAVVAATIAAPVLYLRTAGFSAAGDGGGGLYVRKSALDANAFGFQSADGAWWQLVPNPDGFITVRQTGAVGDNVTNDTPAINAALAASKRVYVPNGNYMLDGPLSAQTSCTIRGAGWEKVNFFRRGVWAGDTLSIGFDAAGGVGSSGQFDLSGIKFEQLHPGFVQGTSTTMTDRLTGGQSHVSLWGGTGGAIRNCWFTGAVTQILVNGTTNLLCEQNIFLGSYDRLNSAISETIASIRVRNTANQGIATMPSFRNNYMAGGPLVARSYTYGTSTYNFSGNGGPFYGLVVEGAEGLHWSGGYAGGQNRSTFLINPTPGTGTAICSNLNFYDLFVDGAELCSFEFTQSAVGQSSNIVNIHNIGFNGQGACENILIANNPNAECTVFGLNFSNNVGQGHIMTPLLLPGCGAGRFSNNQVAAYNFRNGFTSARPDATAGAYITGQSDNLYFDGNTWGGGVNAWGLVNSCAWGVYKAGGGSHINMGPMERAILGLGGGGLTNMTAGSASVYA